MKLKVTKDWKLRGGPSGLHLFNRNSGLNVLLEELPIATSLYARAPRQISIALTNRCDLACAHCYAPKSRDKLCIDTVLQWLRELDKHGTLGVGFGGGEPTLHPEFVKICQLAARETGLSVSFTTHGHHIDNELVELLRGSVHFIRVSMDGVGATYESIRQRPFPKLIERLDNVRAISRFGINVVINERTLPELDEVASIASDAGACELLLLPQMPVRGVQAITMEELERLHRWVCAYSGSLKLCISDAAADGFPVCDPLAEERGLRAYAHIDATGVLKSSSYAEMGIPIGDGGVLRAISELVPKITENL